MPCPTSKILTEHCDKVDPDESLVFVMGRDMNSSYKVETNMARRVDAQRDDDGLTPAPMNERWTEIEQTMMKEL